MCVWGGGVCSIFLYYDCNQQVRRCPVLLWIRLCMVYVYGAGECHMSISISSFIACMSLIFSHCRVSNLKKKRYVMCIPPETYTHVYMSLIPLKLTTLSPKFLKYIIQNNNMHCRHLHIYNIHAKFLFLFSFYQNMFPVFV